MRLLSGEVMSEVAVSTPDKKNDQKSASEHRFEESDETASGRISDSNTGVNGFANLRNSQENS